MLGPGMCRVLQAGGGTTRRQGFGWDRSSIRWKERLRAKSVALTGYAEFLLREKRSSKFSMLTPAEPGRRGAQLSLRVPQHGRSICDKLAAEGIIGDWREPDVFRVAPVPLYNSF